MLNHICKTKKKDYWLTVQIVVNLECFIGKSSSKDVYQCVILHVLSHSPPLSCSTKQYNDQAVNTGLCKVLNLWHSGFFYTTTHVQLSGVLQFSISSVRVCVYTLKL